MAFKSRFDAEKYNRVPGQVPGDTGYRRPGSGSGAPGQPNNQMQTDESRQRITDLLEKRDKNAQTTAGEYYENKNRANREMRRRELDSDKGWGKLGMLGTAVGSMFGAPWLGMGLGSLAGLAKSTAARNKYGGDTIGNFFKSVGDVEKGLIDPVIENPLMAAGAAMGAAPYVMGDKVSMLGKLLDSGPAMGQLGAAGGATPALELAPEFSADMGFQLQDPTAATGALSPGTLTPPSLDFTASAALPAGSMAAPAYPAVAASAPATLGTPSGLAESSVGSWDDLVSSLGTEGFSSPTPEEVLELLYRGGRKF